jgi:hypothetical protein
MPTLRESEHVIDPAKPAFDGCKPCAVTMPEESRKDIVLDFWLARGFKPSQADIIADSLDELLDEIDGERIPNRVGDATEIATNILRLLAAQLKGTSLDKTPSGRALRRVLEGVANDRSLQIDADEIGCSKQAIHAHEKELRGRVCLTCS